MKKYTPIILLSLAIAAIVFYCMTKNEPIKVGQPVQKEGKNSSFVKEIALRIPEISDHSELKLMNGKGDFEIEKHANENQIFSFRNDSSQSVFIQIIPQNNQANIRINQIISPNNESDGPFGKEINYDLTEKGLYQIRIGESLMQGDPFEGNYTLKLQLK
ncbi:hypothetical protein NZD85_10700 [Empedobacter stercoris]|uniref:hypothetical protein n=1 Tax=Empedobacter TaxID=59734 RepID=UPI0021AF36DA|nr:MULTISPECIES: hypothetical protein [Empedobacter]MDM1521766.1 hypothetical protein [Empedobacter sp. 225-1]MDM1541956.1 hypothetical protein [Empedobacter sp. 189-2]UWX66355.1 hypothetical protein NZD85_10700 [Empedobacter stercoris]